MQRPSHSIALSRICGQEDLIPSQNERTSGLHFPTCIGESPASPKLSDIHEESEQNLHTGMCLGPGKY